MLNNHSGTFYPFSLDLNGAVIRQGTFIKKMHHLSWLTSPTLSSMMTRSIQRYEKFFAITADSLKSKNVAVPTLDIDLVWHTHQLLPPSYYEYSLQKTNRFINHDDKIADTVLSTSFEWTAKTYAKRFKEPYSLCLCAYCDAIRTANAPSSAVGRLLSGTNRKVKAQVEDLRCNAHREDGNEGVHISAHNAITPIDTPEYEEKKAQHHRFLEKAHKDALVRAAKKQLPLPPHIDTTAGKALIKHNNTGTCGSSSNSASTPDVKTSATSTDLVHASAALSTPNAPYASDAAITSHLYFANPVCGSLSGGCQAGTCDGGIAIGSCGFKDSGAGGCLAGGRIGGKGENWDGSGGCGDGCGGCGG